MWIKLAFCLETIFAYQNSPLMSRPPQIERGNLTGLPRCHRSRSTAWLMRLQVDGIGGICGNVCPNLASPFENLGCLFFAIVNRQGMRSMPTSITHLTSSREWMTFEADLGRRSVNELPTRWRHSISPLFGYWSYSLVEVVLMKAKILLKGVELSLH